MQPNNRTIIFVIIILIILGVGIVLVSGVSIWGGGYRVDVNGHIWYHPIEEDDWDITYSGSDVSIDQSIFTINPMWFWETEEVYVEVELWGSETYTAGSNLGKFWVTGDDRAFSVTLRHVEPGSYIGYIRCFEIKGGFFGIGADKDLKEEISFELDIIDY